MNERMVALNVLHKPTLLIVAALLMAGCSTAPDPGAGSIPALLPVQPLPQMEFITSENGELRFTLIPHSTNVTVGGLTNETVVYKTIHNNTSYDQRLIPPIWRLQPGDSIRLHLEDKRPVNPQITCQSDREATDHNMTGYKDYTNVHYHGLNVPPKPNGDSIFIQVYPEGSGSSPTSFDYVVDLPGWHPQGLFWFHPHPHGCSTHQMMGGMTGAMVVGDLAGYHYPNITYEKEQILLLRDFQWINGQAPDPPIPSSGVLKTLNGAFNGSLELRENETQFWRFANIGTNLNFNMALVDGNDNPVPFYVIAVDGNVLEQPMQVDNLFLYPGARLEGFVVGPKPGEYYLTSYPVFRSVHRAVAEPEQIMAFVTSLPETTPPPASNNFSAARAANPDSRLSELRNWVADGNQTTKRNITFDATPGFHGINGKRYDVNRNDTVVDFPSIEVWTIRNPTPAAHVFHIHQLDFLVLEANGMTVTSGGLQDTVLVQADSEVKIIIPFNEKQTIGRYVYHCHYIPHEDRGMMANIVVRAPPSG